MQVVGWQEREGALPPLPNQPCARRQEGPLQGAVVDARVPHLQGASLQVVLAPMVPRGRRQRAKAHSPWQAAARDASACHPTECQAARLDRGTQGARVEAAAHHAHLAARSHRLTAAVSYAHRPCGGAPCRQGRQEKQECPNKSSAGGEGQGQTDKEDGEKDGQKAQVTP